MFAFKQCSGRPKTKDFPRPCEGRGKKRRRGGPNKANEGALKRTESERENDVGISSKHPFVALSLHSLSKPAKSELAGSRFHICFLWAPQEWIAERSGAPFFPFSFSAVNGQNHEISGPGGLRSLRSALRRRPSVKELSSCDPSSRLFCSGLPSSLDRR